MSSLNSTLPTPPTFASYNALLAHSKDLEARLTTSLESQKSAFDIILDLQNLIKEGQQEIALLRNNLEHAEGYGKAKRDEQKVLVSRIARLEQDRNIKDPLFQVGVATRVRYLEMAKKLAMGAPRSELDSGCIERGNAAAHNAMGEADAALFHENILSPFEKDKLEASFIRLYRTTPTSYGLLSRKVSHVIDCEATIRTVNVLNEGDRPITQRQQALDHIGYLYDKYEKLSQEVFDSDEEVDLRLSRLVGLTAEIVEEDRKRKRQMQASNSQYRGSHY